MDYEALWLPLFLPLPPSLRLHPLSIAYAEILFVTSGREMACLTCIWERMGVQCALPPCPTRRWNGGGKNASHGPARKSSPSFFLPSQLLLCIFLPRFITFQGGGTTAPIDMEFWQNNPAFIPIVLLFDRAEATFSCRLSRVSGPFTFLRLRRWHGSITYLPFTKRKKEWTKTASASEREEEQASSLSLCFVNRKPELKPHKNLQNTFK